MSSQCAVVPYLSQAFASLYNEHERNIWTLSAVELRMKQNEMDSYVKLAKFLVLLDKRQYEFRVKEPVQRIFTPTFYGLNDNVQMTWNWVVDFLYRSSLF